MTDTQQLCQDLEALWHAEFPLTRTMQVEVVDYANHVLTVRAPVTPNRNIHNTAFAGSLYAIEALAAWGLLYLELQVAGHDASIVHAEGHIDFSAPVVDDIVARADFSGSAHHLEELASTGKTRLTLASELVTQDGVASRFSGLFVVRANRPD